MSGSESQFLIFLSHVARDVRLVDAVAEALEQRGLTCFHSGRDIGDGKDWRHEIEQALLQCDALVAFFRPEFKKSDWTDQEVGYALGRQRQVLSVMLAPGAAPYGFFGSLQAIKGEAEPAALAQRIYDALWERQDQRQRLTSLLLNVLTRSRARPDLRAAALGLRKASQLKGNPPRLDLPTRNRIREAIDSNPVLQSDKQLRRILVNLLGDQKNDDE